MTSKSRAEGVSYCSYQTTVVLDKWYPRLARACLLPKTNGVCWCWCWCEARRKTSHGSSHLLSIFALRDLWFLLSLYSSQNMPNPHPRWNLANRFATMHSSQCLVKAKGTSTVAEGAPGPFGFTNTSHCRLLVCAIFLFPAAPPFEHLFCPIRKANFAMLSCSKSSIPPSRGMAWTSMTSMPVSKGRYTCTCIHLIFTSPSIHTFSCHTLILLTFAYLILI